MEWIFLLGCLAVIGFGIWNDNNNNGGGGGSAVVCG